MLLHEKDRQPKLKEKITESNIPILVDIYDWARLSESFHRNIEEEHEILFSNLQIILSEPPPGYKQQPG